MKRILLCLLFSFNAYASPKAGTKPVFLRAISAFSKGENNGVQNNSQNFGLALRHDIGKNGIGLGFELTRFNYSQPTNSQRNFAVGGVVFRHRYKFIEAGKNTLSAQYLLQTPNLQPQNIGTNSNKWEYEGRVLFIHNINNGRTGTIIRRSSPYFFRGELAYRTKFHNANSNLMRYRLLGAVNILPKGYFFFEHKVDWSLHNIQNISQQTVEVSLMHSLSKKTSLQIGFYKRLGGSDQDYDSHGVLIGLWNEFNFGGN